MRTKGWASGWSWTSSALALGLLVPPPASASSPLPAWYAALTTLPGLEARFEQSSESAVFRAIRKSGRIRLQRGGKLRVTYEPGLELIADGRTLVQHDAKARSAQRLDLTLAMKDAPMLAILVDPSAVERHYTVNADGSSVVLKPRVKGQSEVRLEGQGTHLQVISWVDATGARQRFRLIEPKVVGTFPPATFRFLPPQGTRWVQ